MQHFPYTQAGPSSSGGTFLSYTGCQTCRQTWPCPGAHAEHDPYCALITDHIRRVCTCSLTTGRAA